MKENIFANSNEEDIEEKCTHSGKVGRSMKRDTVKLFQILKFFVRNFEDIGTRLCLYVKCVYFVQRKLHFYSEILPCSYWSTS